MFTYEEALNEQQRMVEFRERHYYKPDTESKKNEEAPETYESKMQKQH